MEARLWSVCCVAMSETKAHASAEAREDDGRIVRRSSPHDVLTGPS